MNFRPMLGHISFELIFVDGPAGSSAAFSDSERAVVLRYATAGIALLTRLATAWAQRGAVKVGEVFTFEINSRTVPIGINPDTIDTTPPGPTPDPARRIVRDDVWQAALMTTLGFPAGTKLSQYSADQRRFLRGQTRFGRPIADSVVILVTKYGCYWGGYVDSGSDIVVLWDTLMADNWAGPPSDVTAHEVGHVFDAPDEYGHCRVDDTVGFFGTPNRNCLFTSWNPNVPNPGIHLDCLMDKTKPVACTFTELHWGWDDSDADGVVDLMAPATFALSTDRVLPGETIDITGTNVWDARAVSFRPVFGGAATVSLPVIRRADKIQVTVPTDTETLVNVEFATRARTPATSNAPMLFVNQVLPDVNVGPAVFGVIPNTAGPGETVRIVGAGLADPVVVMFGATPADLATIVQDPNLPFGNSNEIVLTVPAGGAGVVDVTVTTTEGNSSSFPPFSQFTYR